MDMSDQSLKRLVLQLQQAFAEKDRDFRWKLLKDILPYFLRDNDFRDNLQDISAEYCAILTLLLDALSPTLFINKSQEQLFDDVFLSGIYHDSYIMLVQYLNKSSPSYQQTKVLDLLEKFLHNGLVYRMLCSQCFSDNSEKLKLIASSGFWEELITLLISLPERVANKMNQKTKKIFTTPFYIPFITSAVWNVFCDTHKRLNSELDCNLTFIGKLVGRLCLAGHVSIVVSKLCLKFINVCETDFVWRRIFQNFMTKIPSSSVEVFLAHLLQTVPWYGYMDWLLGDLVITNQNVQYLLTVKFMLIRLLKNEIVLQNIIGYLATSSTRGSLFHKVLRTLLDAWADDSALRHQNFTQQCYLASGLMICASHLKASDRAPDNKDLISKTLHGVQIRIGNPELSVRSIAAIVGEGLTSVLESDVPKLEFGEELEHKETAYLKDLLHVPQKPEKISMDDDDTFDMEFLTISKKNDADKDKNEVKDVLKEGVNDPLDSDDDEDDLKPYDMSNDVPQESVKRPLYIRDCLQGLLEAEKPEWTEQCLRSAEKLIRANPEEIPDIAVEMSKVLLHLDNTFGMEDFVAYRHRALIALTASCPVKVAQYLTSQFYEKDYNIRQRIDILEVVAAASQELSQPKYRVAAKPHSVPPSISVSVAKHTEEHWRDVIEKRLEAKTRRITMGPRKPVPEAELNIFGSVAGYFFFPLMEKFDRESKMLNLLGEDSYVLGRLLYTLGIVMYSAANTIQAKKMGSCLLKFIESIRNHTETFVREAAIFATSTVYMSVPSFHLLSDLQEDVLSSQNWLNDIVDKDCNAECQIQAAKTLQLLMKTIEEEMPALTEAMLLS